MVRLCRLLHYAFVSFVSSLACLCALHLIYFYSYDHRILPLPVTSTQSRGFLVETKVCMIPDLDPFDESVIDFVHRKEKITCSGKTSITYVDGTILRINRTFIKHELSGEFSHCRYQAILRNKFDSDFTVTYSEMSEKFESDVEIKDEFIRIYCYSYSGGVMSTNFHAFILPKIDVDTRCHSRIRQHALHFRPAEIINVLMIGVDSVSRLNFIRQMPRTRQFLLEELNAVEMLGYNKVADNTFVNIVPMLAGKFVEELPWNETMKKMPFDNFTFIWKNFTKAGYRTMYAEDSPKIAIFNYEKEGFHQAPTDYYNRPLSLAMESHRSVWNNDHHCVGSKLETNIVLKYVTDFVRRSSNRPHFGFAFITRLTHENFNDAGAADEPHLHFFKQLKSDRLINNTIVFYFSDHGNRFGEMRNTYVGKAEERLPLLFVVFPVWFSKRYPKLFSNIRINSHRLTTPFDIFETLKDILYFRGIDRSVVKNQRGISLFSEIPELRSCSQAHILPHWCMCMRRKVIPLSEKIIRKTAFELVNKINYILSKHLNSCAKLILKSIQFAEQLIANNDLLRFKDSVHDVLNRTVHFGERSSTMILYQVTVETEPGNAVFEGTLQYDEHLEKFDLAGDISRINTFGSQSNCVDDFWLKKFCYCLSI